jgi:hypothetical protein
MVAETKLYDKLGKLAFPDQPTPPLSDQES